MIRKLLTGLAIAAGLVVALPSQQAKAVTLLGPGPAAATKHVADNSVTQVRWDRRRYHRGHARHYRSWRPRRAWHRRHWRPPVYHFAAPRCRVVWTHFGWQRVCHRPWHW